LALRIFGILVAFFAIVFTILGLQDPYSLNIKSYALDFKNIEANKLKAYELNTTLVKSYYNANSWIRYNDKDLFENFSSQNLDFNLSANTFTLLKNSDEAILQGDVSYQADKMRIFSQEVYFFRNNKVLNSNVGFEAFIDDKIIKGQKIKYDLKQKILEIQGIKLWFQGR